MKLHYSVLSRLIEIPAKDPLELRHILDDLGLEVKDISGVGEHTVYNIETLANRGDHVHVLGVARELSARFLTSINFPPMAPEFPAKGSSISVRVSTPLCSRYALLELSLPASMSVRPEICQVLHGEFEAPKDRPAIVDVLNYVQIELGQPMHAFDRDKIDGEIIVDELPNDTTITALDGREYRVPAGAVVIRDRKKVVAVAGVIGCANSMCTMPTTRVLLESACFDPVSVRKTARAMGISTDASYIFERGSDIEMVGWALRRAVYLAGGTAGAVKSETAHPLGFTVVDVRPPEKRRVVLRLATLRKQIGLPRLADVEVTSRLKNLGYGLEVSAESQTITATVPSWRLWDVRHEADVIEDFARSHGLSRVKLELPDLDYETPESSEHEKFLEKAERALCGQGFYEVMTKSFYSHEEVGLIEQLDGPLSQSHVSIKNALERGYSHLKLTNAIHLSRLAEYNHRRGVQCFKVFELSRLFRLPAEGVEVEGSYEFERDVLSMAFSGRFFEHEWRKPPELEHSMFLFKGVMESVLQALSLDGSVSEQKHPLLHPGYQGAIRVGRLIVGHFGVVHPLIIDALGVSQPVLYAEFDVQRLVRCSPRSRAELPSEFPAVRRDVTLRIEPRCQAGKVRRIIEELDVPSLKEVAVYDDFRRSDEAFRRLTLRLTFQHSERTLSSDEVERSLQGVLATLREQHQLELAA